MTRPISILLLLSTAALCRASWDRAEYSRTFDKTLSVQSGERIAIEHRFGDINVHTHPQQDVVIHAEIRVSASDSNEAKNYADRVEIVVEPSSELFIRTRYPETPKSFFGTHNISYSVHYELTIPESSPLQLRNAFGRVFVTGAKAGADIVTSHGDLRFQDGRGIQHLENSFARIDVSHNVGDVTVETTNGAVDAGDITGALTIRDRFATITAARISNRVSITNGNGTVELSDGGNDAEIKTSFAVVTVRNVHGNLAVTDNNGKIDASGITGSATLHTSFAEVQASDVQHELRVESQNGAVTVDKIGAASEIKTSFGPVRATNIAGELTVHDNNGSVHASNVHGAQITTSFGAVMLDPVAGAIDVQDQNGSVEVANNLREASCQPVTVRTSFGAIRVHLLPDASYHVSARTSFAKIRSDFPLTVQGSLASDEINGTIGGGRCEMNLADQNASIEIVRH